MVTYKAINLLTHNQVVPGSSPGGPTKGFKQQMFETFFICKAELRLKLNG